MVQKLKSRGLTIVIVEHSAKPLVLSYSAVRRDRLHWNNETIVAPLMVTLQMIMRHKLANRIPQSVFTKEDHLLQTILPNRSDEPFRISIQIRRLRRQFDGLDSDRGKRSEKLPRVKRISIVDQIALPREKTINGIGEIAFDLNHPQPFAELAMPPICTRRVDRSMKNRTMNRVNPEQVHTSMVKKSVATI